MTRNEKAMWNSKKTIAYYSGFGGIEVKEVLNGYDDYIIYVCGAWSGERSIHKKVIRYDTNKPYFLHKGCRIHLDDCIRM